MRGCGDGCGGGDEAGLLHALEEVVAGVGAERLKEPGSQQFLASLADVAMEIYAAETVALRVAKLDDAGGAEAREVRAALAALVLERSAERVRVEARTILGELRPGDDGIARLAGIDALLPAPRPLVAARARVAEWLVARDGLLPGEAA